MDMPASNKKDVFEGAYIRRAWAGVQILVPDRASAGDEGDDLSNNI